MCAREKLDPDEFAKMKQYMDVSEPGVPTYASPPHEIRAFFRKFHESELNIRSSDADRILYGRPVVEIEKELWGGKGDDTGVLNYGRYKGEAIHRGDREIPWTDYSTARAILKQLRLRKGDHVADWGSGYGRLLNYAGMVTETQNRGIEMVEERVDYSRAAAEKLSLKSVEYICGKVQDQDDLSWADVVYAFAPFSPETAELAHVRLREAIEEKPAITVVTRGANMMGPDQLRRHKIDFVPVYEAPITKGGAVFYENSKIAGTAASRVIVPPNYSSGR